MGTRDEYAALLCAIPADQWEELLALHSGLPGPRGNLELLAAVGDIAPAQRLRAWSAAPDEYLAACGTAGLGRLVLERDEAVPRAVDLLRLRASDGRWRVREAVAIALQRIGDGDPRLVREITDGWTAGSPYELRAAVAGLCEPRLLRDGELAAHTLRVLDLATAHLHRLAPARRHDADVRTLRKGLAYAWSVAVAASPSCGAPMLERWAAIDDPDVRWLVRQNLTKARLRRADPDAVARMAAALGAPPPSARDAQPTSSSSAAPTV